MNWRMGILSQCLSAALVGFASLSYAHSEAPLPKPAQEKPTELEGVGIQEQLGKKLDLSLKFKDETGRDVTLGDYFNGQIPVILSPIYFSCPGLCSFHLNGLTEALKEVDWSVGTKFRVVAFSFDAREGADVAIAKKANYMKMYNRPGTEAGWTFLSGSQESIQKLTESIGFQFKWDETEKQWAHASAAVVVSPDGTISRYLPGIVFEPKDVRLAVLEAAEGKVGTFIDQLVLFCFHYNPHQSRYTVYAFNIMKLGGAAMVLLLALWLLPVWIRSRRHATARRS